MIAITAGMTGAQYLAAINNIRKEYNVKDYGNFISGVVSDAVSITNTETLQAAINAVFTAGGGRLIVPAGLYKIGGPLQTNINSTNPNCQVYVPLSALTENGAHIVIEGESPQNYRYVATTGTVINTTGGVILESTIAGSGTLPAVFGTPTVGGMNYTYITFKNVTIRTTTNAGAVHSAGTMSGINFENMSNFQFDQIAVEITSTTAAMAEPTNETYGILFPKQLNYAFTLGGVARILGYKYGVVPGEHLNVHQFYIAFCGIGIHNKNSAQHGININCLSVEGCPIVINHINNQNIYIATAHIEHYDSSPAWCIHEYDVYVTEDAKSVYFGHINTGIQNQTGVNEFVFTTNDPNRTSFRFWNGRDVDLDMITLVTTNTWSSFAHKRAKIVLTGDSTLTISNARTGEILELLVLQDGTGGHSLTINTIGVTTEQAASAATLVKCTYDGTTWRFFS